MLENAVIVIGTDLTDLSLSAVEAACALGRRFGARRLVLAHGVKSGGPFLELGGQARAVERARAAIADVPLDAGDMEVERVVRSGPPARVIVEVAEEQEARLIVVASPGFGALRRTLIGSTAATVARAAHNPVLIVAPGRDGRGPVERVVAAIDLSPGSETVLRAATDMCTAYGSELCIASVFEHPGVLVGEAGEPEADVPREELDRARVAYRDALERHAELPRARQVPTEVTMIEGETPDEALLREVKNRKASLLVIGTSGQDAWHRMVLGTTAERLCCESPSPVLVLPFGTTETP